MKTCYIVRAVSGSGKSTFAEHLKDLHVGAMKSLTVCSADDYHIDEDGNYNFEPKNLPLAHEYCWDLFQKSVDIGLDVIVDNTNTAPNEYLRYKEYAIENGYNVFQLIVEPVTNQQESVHDVPEFILKRQADKLVNSLKDNLRNFINKK